MYMLLLDMEPGESVRSGGFFFPNLVVIKSYICANRICGSSKILVRYIIHETDSYPL